MNYLDLFKTVATVTGLYQVFKQNEVRKNCNSVNQLENLL